MSFNNFGQVMTIAPGQTLPIVYWFNDGDHGAQFAMPDIKTPGATLMAYDQGKVISDRGAVSYSVTIRNDGNVDCRFNLQGGGFGGSPFNNTGGLATLVPGAVQSWIRTIGIAEDRGAQYMGPDIKSHNSELVCLYQGKEKPPSGGARYSVAFHNEGQSIATYNFQGGGIENQPFNNAGQLFSLAPGEPLVVEFDFLFQDKGAQYAMADLKTNNAAVAAVEHGKELSRPFAGQSIVKYYVKFENIGDVNAIFNIQGGGLS
jgi:hypothetical protein